MAETVVRIEDIGRFLRETSADLGWSQRELSRRARVPQTAISRAERGHLEALDLEQLLRIAGAIGARLKLGIDMPQLSDRTRQRDRVHARCLAFVAARLRAMGWTVGTEVEVSGAHGPGWIDVLAWRSESGDLLVVEVKTEIEDVGQVQRRLAWYSHAGWTACRRFGWSPRRSTTALFVLATERVEDRPRDNADLVRLAFPGTAATLATWLAEPAATEMPRWPVARIDPLSRSRRWLREPGIDRRQSRPPYVDYAAVARRIEERWPSGRRRRRESVRLKSNRQ